MADPSKLEKLTFIVTIPPIALRIPSRTGLAPATLSQSKWGARQCFMTNALDVWAAENNNYPRVAPGFCSDSRRGKWRILKYVTRAETQKQRKKTSKVG